MMTSNKDAKFPENSSVVRVENFDQKVVIKAASDDANSTAIYYQYFEDSKGSFPATIYNWAISQGIPGWIGKFTKACQSYGAEGLQQSKVDTAKELGVLLDNAMEKAFAF